MWWETSCDYAPSEPNGNLSLIKTVVDRWGGPNGGRLETLENTLDYPGTKYDNMRNGMP